MRVCFLLLVLFSANVFSQNEKQNALSEADSTQLATFKNKIVQYINPLPDSAFFYIKKYESFAKDINHPESEVDALYMLGSYYRRVQQNDSAITAYKESLQRSNEIDYDLGKGRAYNNLGRIYYLQGKMESSIQSEEKAIASIKNFNEQSLLIVADSHTAIAIAYSRQNKMEDAIHHLLKVDSIHSKSPLRPDAIAAAYQNLGNIYLDLNEYPSAEENFLKANAEFKKLPPQAAEFYLNTTNVNLGNTYLKMGHVENAEGLLTKSYDYFSKVQDLRLVAEIAMYLGEVYVKQNNLEKAEAYFKESFNLHKNNDRNYEAALSAWEISKLELENNRPNQALEFLDFAATLNSETKNTKLTADILLTKAQAFQQKGDYKEALFFMSASKKLQDSLQEAQSSEKIKEIEAIYETESKDREIALLTSQNELAEQQKKNQRNILLGSLIVVTLAGLFLFFQYRNRQKTNKKLKELDTAKSTFFTNISHEFRTPLTLIKGPIEDQLQRDGLSPSDERNLQTARNNTVRLESLVDQLLALSQLESGNLNLTIQQGNLSLFLSTIAEAFQYRKAEKNIVFSIDLKSLKNESWFDREAIQKIVTNLLGNAFKYTPVEGLISLKAQEAQGKTRITIHNSGSYIPKEKQQKIFKRFYQTDEHNPGTGIGLALTKELVELHKGNISVESSQEKGTTFHIEIPTDKSFYEASEITSEMFTTTTEEIIETKATVPEVTTELDAEAPVLLIVEDNLEVRKYVSSIFEKDHKIYFATNGKEGVTLALEHIPDIIISDLMMPEMNGFQFTETVKTKELTAHIPIILLTAKTEDSHKLEGTVLGADAYLTKPFNSQILRATVQNLLDNRKKLQQRFSQEVVLTPKEIAVTSADEKFLERLEKVLDQHLINPDFSANDFSDEMGVSRMQLHRKLKALLGQSTTEFLRTQRLRSAALLIEQEKISISEVCYNVGFNDPSYFAKCFKQEFGMSPTEYSQKKVS